MALFKPLLNFLGLTDNKPVSVKEISRAQRRKDNHKQIVAALRQYRPLGKPSRLDWLKKRKQDMHPSGDAGNGPDVKPPAETPGLYQQSFQGKMPIRATDEAIALIKQYQTKESYDRIQFPEVFRENGEIVAINSQDESKNTRLGVVKVVYENQVNPDSANKIGINLDTMKESGMLNCTVVYPAVPTCLSAQSQPSKVS